MLQGAERGFSRTIAERGRGGFLRIADDVRGDWAARGLVVSSKGRLSVCWTSRESRCMCIGCVQVEGRLWLAVRGGIAGPSLINGVASDIASNVCCIGGASGTPHVYLVGGYDLSVGPLAVGDHPAWRVSRGSDSSRAGRFSRLVRVWSMQREWVKRDERGGYGAHEMVLSWSMPT